MIENLDVTSWERLANEADEQYREHQAELAALRRHLLMMTVWNRYRKPRCFASSRKILLSLLRWLGKLARLTFLGRMRTAFH